MNFNPMCRTCTYRDTKVQVMRRISTILSDRYYSNPTKLIHFNWGVIEHCKYGISKCDKINSNQREFNLQVEQLNVKLSAFVENPEKQRYHELLQFLRGNFPGVYKQVEQECQKKWSEE